MLKLKQFIFGKVGKGEVMDGKNGQLNSVIVVLYKIFVESVVKKKMGV